MTAAVLLLLAAVPAQSPGKATLRWFGQSMFQLETATGRRIVWDPHAIPEFGRVPVKADVVLASHLHSDHTRMDLIEDAKSARLFAGVKPPAARGKLGDWNLIDEKVGPVRVRSVGLFHDAVEGMQRGRVVAWVVEADGLTYCHLGDLGHELTEGQVKKVGPVDVLIVPVGGIYTINGEQARGVVEQIKPRRLVLPMHYGVPGYDELLPANEFLDGLTNVKRTPATNEVEVDPAAMAPATPEVRVPGWKK